MKEQMPKSGVQSSALEITSETNYKRLFDHLPVAVYCCDREGRITFFNKQAVKLWGYQPDVTDPSLKYCACYKIFVNGEYIAPDKTPMAIALQTGRSFRDVEAQVERPDGSTFYAAVSIDPVLDDKNNVTGAINVFTDISDKKRAEETLRENADNYRSLATSLEHEIQNKVRELTRKTDELKKSEERYHKMVEEIEDYAILLLDKNGIIQNWNKGAEKIKGYKEEEIVGKNFQEFYLAEDRERGLPLQFLEHARTTGKAVHEGWRRKKDGTAFWASIVLTALHDDDNNVIGFSKVTRDLTERKLTEDKMKDYLSQLEFQNRELEQFVYAASHDIKEPLRKMHFYIDYLANNAEGLDGRFKDYISRSLKAAERMKGLIEDLLTYSRSTSNAENHETVDLNEVIEEVIMTRKEELEHMQSILEVQKLPLIRNAIPFQLSQLMHNLIDNAIKYRHCDRNLVIKITSRVVKENEIPGLNSDQNDSYYCISVADNGIGFDPEFSTKIFEIFQRLYNATGASGSGIGLAICKKIMQNHNGYIVATGKKNKGAMFSVYFPV